MKYYTMIDIGASSGRIMLAEIDNKQLALQEVHRFKNGFNRIDGSDRWDIETIFEEILTGLSKLKALGVTECHLGIDTWAVDCCLIGTDGQLLQLPISYRDERTKDTMEKVAQEIDKETIYAKTGIQFQNFNTLYQLYEEDKDLLARTDKILMIPDYLAYRLTGEMVGEVTNVSSSQMLNLETGEFDKDLLELVGIQAEKDLVQHHGLRAVAGCFEHEVRAVLAKQAGSVIDQIALFGQGPQIDGGVTHWFLLFAHTQKIYELWRTV